jgi:hypothetical protein
MRYLLYTPCCLIVLLLVVLYRVFISVCYVYAGNFSFCVFCFALIGLMKYLIAACYVYVCVKSHYVLEEKS